MKTYKAIIFDIDGTLLNTLDKNMQTLKTIIKEETNQDLPIEAVYEYAPYPGLNVMHMLGFKQPETVYQRWVQLVESYPFPVAAFEGVKEMMMTLKHDYLLAVVSSKTHKQYLIDRAGHDFFDDIQACVLFEDTTQHKPNPDPLQLCLKQLQLAASEVLYIGDANQDALACQAANIDFGLALWGSIEPSFIEATYRFNTPNDVTTMLKRNH